MDKTQEKIQRVVKSLESVNEETKKYVMDLSECLLKEEIVTMFNQYALDFFNDLTQISYEVDSSKAKIFTSYSLLYETSLNLKKNLPLEKFTLTILEHADKIYMQEEEHFLEMDIPNKEINIGNNKNEFGIIQSDEFKKLWKKLGEDNKSIIKDKVILLTTYAHAYLYKILQESNK